MLHSREHRKDIDGLRAIAVISVIIFHLGYLPQGYLGVDVFFVISGYLYFSELEISKFSLLKEKYNINPNKVWNVGTKNFGKNNGFFYNKKKDSLYCKQSTKMDDGFLEKNEKLKSEWKDRYIDLIGLMINKDNSIPVFTNDCKMISQDCRHLTRFGAKYFASLINNKINL